MNKRLLALIVAVIFIIGSVATGFAATFEDVVDTDFEDEVNRLVALEIISGYPDGTFRPEGLVTRAEFAKITVSATGVGAAAEYAKGATKFTDVEAEHWAAGYINVATDLGIIQGYGDGRFGPEDQVTYAEAITMIVRSLGYEPAAQAKGGYPGGYLAVAAEEDITDGITVVANVAANRGDIAIMVDNSLEVDMMVQSSYGDKPTWEVKEGETLLKKLGVDEIEGNVIEIARVNDKLDDKEIKVRLDDEDDTKKTYEIVSKDNPEALFGKAVKLLVKDKKVVHVEIDTDADDILIDTVKTVDGATIELKVKDKEYDLAKDAEVYVNFDDEEDVAQDMYGTFILDGKEIVFANLFAFEDDNVGLVTKVAKEEIEYESVDGDFVLELDEYDDVFVYNKDFTAASLDDIDENSVIYFWDNKDDDEVFIVVVNDVVKGEVTRARDDRVTVDGSNYKKGTYAIVSKDAGDDYSEWLDIDDVKDLIDEKVVLYLDLNGDVAAIVGETDVTSDTLYGIATWCDIDARKPVMTIFTVEGKEVDYYFDDKDDAIEVEDAEGEYAVVSYKLNSDGEIDEGTLRGVEKVKADGDTTYNALFTKVEDEIVNDIDDIDVYDLTKKADKKYVVQKDGDNETARFYITKDTVIMKVFDGKDFDPEVIKYEDLVKIELDKDKAVVFGEEGKNAKFIVFIDSAFEGVKDDIYFGVVTDDPWKVGSNWKAEIDVFGEGKVDFKLGSDAEDNFEEGVIAAFKLDSSDKVYKPYYTVTGDVYAEIKGDSLTDVEIIVAVVKGVDGSYIETNNKGDYKVLDGAVLYKVDSDNDLDGTIRLSRIKKGDGVVLVLDENQVKAALVRPGKAWEENSN